MKKSKKFIVWSIILSIVLVISAVLIMYQAFHIGILPNNYLILIAVIVCLFVIILLLLLHYVSKKTWSKVLSSLLIILCSAVLFVGNTYLARTNDFLNTVTEKSDQVKHTVNVYTLKSSKIKKLEKLNNKKIGTLKSIDTEGTQKSLKDIKKDIKFVQKNYDSVQALVKALYDQDVDAIVLNKSYQSNVTDIEEYQDFISKTKVVHQTIYYTEDKLDSLAVSNISTHPFTIEISGNDEYGDLEEDSRSDVNMLVTVNPNTSTVLLTSIPRDYYIQYACEDGECPIGELDKLTHTGMSGVDTTRDTLSQMLDIDINYVCRINFDGAKNIVDALGGVDVTVEPGLAVETFYTDSTLQGVTEGVNHLDGARALAFARERYAYEDGDKQRVRNQQIVLEALVKKAISTDAIANYTSLLDAMSGCFSTNMSNEEIKQFIKFQLQANPNWTFETYVLDGYGDQYYCAMSGQDASVLVPDQRSVDIGSQKIKAVLEGKSSKTISDELTGEQTIPDYMVNAVSVGMTETAE